MHPRILPRRWLGFERRRCGLCLGVVVARQRSSENVSFELPYAI